jgi:hypothetical protein
LTSNTSVAIDRRVRDDYSMTDKRRRMSVWWQMISGMRAYGVAITVVWAMCACTVLLILAFAAGNVWGHVGFGAGAVIELLLSGLTLRFLARASVRGRFDV